MAICHVPSIPSRPPYKGVVSANGERQATGALSSLDSVAMLEFNVLEGLK